MNSVPGLVVGIAMAKAEGVPGDRVFPIAMIAYTLGLTPVSLLVTQALARREAPPRPAPKPTEVGTVIPP